VYISREGMDRRRIVNRLELLDALGEFEFESYRPEEMSFEKQVALYKNADLLVGPVGSSFANAVFSEECAFVEMFPPDTFNFWNYELINVLGMEHHPVWGESSAARADRIPSHQDFTVDTQEVVALVENLLNT
jgi:capsular polysaccharide biosynthesis protein